MYSLSSMAHGWFGIKQHRRRGGAGERQAGARTEGRGTSRVIVERRSRDTKMHNYEEINISAALATCRSDINIFRSMMISFSVERRILRVAAIIGLATPYVRYIARSTHRALRRSVRFHFGVQLPFTEASAASTPQRRAAVSRLAACASIRRATAPASTPGRGWVVSS